MTAKRKKSKITAAEWNRLYPVGTRVLLTVTRGDPEIETATRSEAWELGDGTPVVKVDGKAGGYGLDFVRPVP